jgi:hypothetical protein
MWLTSLDNGGCIEMVITQNANTAGVQVLASKPWQSSESVLISQPPSFCAVARIAYCRRLPSENFVLGISFETSPQDWMQCTEDSAPKVCHQSAVAALREGQ